MAKDTRYRLVSDYGYGDKTWLSRDLTPEMAIKELNEQIGGDIETIEQALDLDHPIYSIEIDSWDDEEDWDWMDS